MISFVAFPIVLMNAALVLRNLTAGIAAYVVLALVLPHPEIAGRGIAYEILALPLVLVAVVVRRPRLAHPKFHLFLGAYLAAVILSTIIGTTTYGTGVEFIRFQGLVRFLLLLSLARELLGRVRIEWILLTVIAINAAMGLAQLLLPGMGRLFFRLYGRSSQAVLERYALEDVIPRASGTFSSPVILGSVALLALAVAWAALLAERPERRYRWLLVFAGLAGIVSLTKTFLLGAPLVLAGGLLLSLAAHRGRPLRFKPRSAAISFAALLVAGGLVVWVGGVLGGLGFNVSYYLSFLVDPRAALATRYGTGGLLGGTVDVIAANPVFGVGMTRVQGEFLGDSTYTLLLHSTGLIGAALAAFGFTSVVQTIIRRGKRTDLLVLGALLAAGVGLPILFSLPGALAVAYLFADERHPAEVVRTRRARRSGLPSVPLSAGA